MTQAKKITIYEMGGCCSTSLTDPGKYENLERLNQSEAQLKAAGIVLDRVNVAQKPQSFSEDTALGEFTLGKGAEVFPVTVVDGKVVKSADFPSDAELSIWTGIDFVKSPLTNNCCSK